MDAGQSPHTTASLVMAHVNALTETYSRKLAEALEELSLAVLDGVESPVTPESNDTSVTDACCPMAGDEDPSLHYTFCPTRRAYEDERRLGPGEARVISSEG